MYEDNDGHYDVEEIWSVIGAFFEEKGLVFQQIDSYNLFIKKTIQQHLRDHTALEIIPQEQYIPNENIPLNV